MSAWFGERREQAGLLPATRELLTKLWEFLRDSTPQRRRQRYGDAEFDWEYRVDTTSGTTTPRQRFVGMFHSAYQPTEPGLFREMMSAVRTDFKDFTFVDVGSGKGRALLLAAEYPFRRVIGIELIAELHHTAQLNIERYRSEHQKCFAIESVCGDARSFAFPDGPLLIYLFNPLPETGLVEMLGELQQVVRSGDCESYVLYHNPVHQAIFLNFGWLRKRLQTDQYAIYGTSRA